MFPNGQGEENEFPHILCQRSSGNRDLKGHNGRVTRMKIACGVFAIKQEAWQLVNGYCFGSMNYLADFEKENLGVENMTACPDKVLIIIFGGLKPTILCI